MSQTFVKHRENNFRSWLFIICFCLSLAFIFFNPALAGAQTIETQKSRPQLSLEKIMAGQEFYGTPPSSPTWAVDGKTLYFQWKKPGEKSSEIYAVSLKNPVPVKITRWRTGWWWTLPRTWWLRLWPLWFAMELG